MTIKDIENSLINYINLNTTWNYKENAWKEFDKVREKFELDDLKSICFIIDDYPNFDHLLFRITDEKNFFIKFGLSREYLKSLSKKDIHKVAKSLYSFFKGFNLKRGVW